MVGVALVFLISGPGARADTVVRGGLHPFGVALDTSGDVFIADTQDNRVVVDRPDGSGGYIQSVVDDTRLHAPEAVAVDGSGDVFIADNGNERVVVDRPDGAGGYTQSMVDDNGLNNPTGVAVDGSGDVFIADNGNNRVVVDKPTGAGGYSQSVVATGLSDPAGVAADGAGNVFIADTDNSRVLLDKPNGSGGYTQSVVDDTGLSFPDGVAVDGSGDVVIADTDNGRVLLDKPNGSGGYAQSVVDDTGLTTPRGVAVDGSGDVFTADNYDYSSKVVVDKPTSSGGYTQSLVDAGVLGPVGVAIDASGDLFIADTEHSRVVVDKPDGSGGYIQSVVDDTGLSYPEGVAVDGAGDVFIADYSHSRVVVDKPNGSGGYTQSLVDAGVSFPTAVAVDHSGDVFIADYGDSRVVVDKPNGSGGYTQSLVGHTGLASPNGVAVDRSGDVFIADTYNNRVVVDKPNGSGGYVQSVVDTDLSYPAGLTLDSSGDLFIADTNNNRVVVDKPGGSGGYTQRVVDAGLSHPAGVAVDGSGNLFIADTYNNRVVEHAASAPTAAFTSAQSSGSFAVAFADTSAVVSPATITGWSWNFGDGSPVSTQQSPIHAYAHTGTYTASLTVTDSNGQTGSVSEQVVVVWVKASLTYPTAGQTNVSTITPFRWADLAAGQGYQLWIGTSEGGGELLQSGLLSATTSSYQVPALPTGKVLYARLFSEVAGWWHNWRDIAFTVTTNPSGVAFTYPTLGQQSVNTLTPFSWGAVAGAQAYQVTIGSKPGAADLANSGVLASNVRSYREPALPTGTTLYARIAAEVGGSWTGQGISFSAGPNPVAFTNPVPGQAGVSTPAKFTWSTFSAATGYQLWIGTSRGSGSLLKSGLLPASTSSYQVPALPSGVTLYARIYTGVASGWGNYEDVTFTTAATGAASDAAALAARQPTPAWMRRLLRNEPNLH